MSDIDDCLESVKRLTRDRGEVMRAGNDLITSLRALAAARHDDLSIAVDAVIEIERQRAEIERLRKAHQAACEGGDLLRAENERLRAALRWYADPRNHFPVERRSPGDPDPAVVFVEEPPIMLDGGERARRALEGKP